MDLERAVLNMVSKIKEKPELREWFVNFTPNVDEGYMFSMHPNITILNQLVESDNHSGASFAYTCREAKRRLI